MHGHLLLISDQAGDLHPEVGERIPERPDPLPRRPGKPALTATVHEAAAKVEPCRMGRGGPGSHAVCASFAPKASSRGAAGGAVANW